MHTVCQTIWYYRAYWDSMLLSLNTIIIIKYCKLWQSLSQFIQSLTPSLEHEFPSCRLKKSLRELNNDHDHSYGPIPPDMYDIHTHTHIYIYIYREKDRHVQSQLNWRHLCEHMDTKTIFSEKLLMKLFTNGLHFHYLHSTHAHRVLDPMCFGTYDIHAQPIDGVHCSHWKSYRFYKLKAKSLYECVCVCMCTFSQCYKWED